MWILVADDEPGVVTTMKAEIHLLGHSCDGFSRLAALEAHIADQRKGCDIVYVDNHFPEEQFGIERIASIRAVRPDADIVIMTARPLEPELVARIVQLRAGFFEKRVEHPVRVRADVLQRVNNRRAREIEVRRRLQQIREAADEGGEGIFRLLPFLRRHDVKVAIGKPESLGQQVIIPRFEKIETVHLGQRVEVNHSTQATSSRDIQVSTAMEVGLSISESAAFLATSVGVKLASKLKKVHTTSAERTVSDSVTRSSVLVISDAEDKDGVRRKEIYRGLSHQKYRVAVKAECDACGNAQACVLHAYVPLELVEVMVTYDKYGAVIADGRKAHLEKEVS